MGGGGDDDILGNTRQFNDPDHRHHSTNLDLVLVAHLAAQGTIVAGLQAASEPATEAVALAARLLQGGLKGASRNVAATTCTACEHTCEDEENHVDALNPLGLG